jgi:hypothetical protein
LDRRSARPPGVLAYGDTEAEAKARAVSLALRVIADRVRRAQAIVRDRIKGDRSLAAELMRERKQDAAREREA